MLLFLGCVLGFLTLTVNGSGKEGKAGNGADAGGSDLLVLLRRRRKRIFLVRGEEMRISVSGDSNKCGVLLLLLLLLLLVLPPPTRRGSLKAAVNAVAMVKKCKSKVNGKQILKLYDRMIDRQRKIPVDRNSSQKLTAWSCLNTEVL